MTTFVLGFAVSSFQDGAQTIQCSNLVNNGNLAAVCGDPTKQAALRSLLQATADRSRGVRPPKPDSSVLRGHPRRSSEGPEHDPRRRSDRTRPRARHRPTRRPRRASSPVRRARRPSAQSYLASFKPSPGLPWTGDVLRQRQQCTQSAGKYTGNATPSDPTKGDDFGLNLNSNTGNARTFIALQPAPIAAPSGGGRDGDDPSLRHDDGGRRPRKVQRDAVRRAGGQHHTEHHARGARDPPALSVQLGDDARSGEPGLDPIELRGDGPRLHVRAAARSAPTPATSPSCRGTGERSATSTTRRPSSSAPPGRSSRRGRTPAFSALRQTRETIVYAATNDGSAPRLLGGRERNRRTTSAGRCSCPP